MTTATRIADALESIAARLQDPDQALVGRVATLEELLTDFIALMETADHTTDQDWVDLLTDVKVALGLEVASV